jgi:hypothetical protein
MKNHYRLVSLLIFVTLQCVAQSGTLYDNFEKKVLNQTLWYSTCGGFSVTENCSTDTQDEHLHLARGLTGNNDSNSGTNGGAATVFFVGPVAITSITADILVRRIDEVSCAANPVGFGGHADIIARFFNSGDGTTNGDVGATIFIGRSASDPKGQLGVIGNYFNNGDYSHTVWLANVQMGTPITASLTWDQANHRFLYSVTNKVTHITNTGILAYPFSDTTPAADGEKHLDVEIFPDNCTSNSTWVHADALFDNVYVH